MWGAILSAILSNAKSSEGQSTVPVASNWGNTIKGPQSSDSAPELAPQDFKVAEKDKEKKSGGLMDGLGDMLGNMGGGKGGAKGGGETASSGASSAATSSGAGASGAVSDKNAKDTTGPVGKESNGKGWNWKDAVKRLIDGQEKRYGGDWGVTPVQAGNYGAPMVSDERLKRLFKDDGAIDAFSKIDAYVYKYNNKAQNLYGGQKGVDKETHFGPIAQDLAKNPVTNGTVHKDENGYLNVDTRQLSLTNTAMISQLARKVQELEEKLGGR